MSQVCVGAFSLSLDGFGAGPEQSLENPLGVNGKALHEWAFKTRTFRAMFGQEGGDTGVDDQFAARSFENVGAWILGRNMFGPVRGPWLNESWKGWWGDNPPYHVPVFVLTHHSRAPIIMTGGRLFISSPTASRPPCGKRGRRPKARVSESAVVYRRCSRAYAPASSIRCISQSRRSFSAPVRISSAASICARSATRASSACRRQARSI